MSEDRLPAKALQSEWGEAARRAARLGEPAQDGRQVAATRTVGVYERPARRTKLSLPVIIVMILATLISLILSVRFLF